MTTCLYAAYLHSKGTGALLIRIRNPGGWANHAAFLWAPSDADVNTLLATQLYEARYGSGVTGPTWKPRALADALAGGDQIELYRLPLIAPGNETIAETFADAQLQKGYDTPGVIGFIPIPILQNAVAKQQQRQADAVWFCSEYLLAVTVKRLTPLLVNCQPFDCAPEDLRRSPAQTFVYSSFGAAPYAA